MCISVLPACNVCACMPGTCGGSDQDIRYPGTGFTDSCKSCPEGTGKQTQGAVSSLSCFLATSSAYHPFLGGVVGGSKTRFFCGVLASLELRDWSASFSRVLGFKRRVSLSPSSILKLWVLIENTRDRGFAPQMPEAHHLLTPANPPQPETGFLCGLSWNSPVDQASSEICLPPEWVPGFWRPCFSSIISLNLNNSTILPHILTFACIIKINFCDLQWNNSNAKCIPQTELKSRDIWELCRKHL